MTGRLPPGGTPIARAAWRAALFEPEPERVLCEALARALGAARVALYASGREALRVAFARLAKRSGRGEVLLPAYTCYSVPAAAVAAGLRVRLVDVTPEGRIDAAALERLPGGGASALLVSNLFGVPEPLGPLRAWAAAEGVALIDDAAQALGARDAEGPVGGRGALGVLSFGRGKPLSALGGGALAWPDAPDDLEPPTAPAPRRLAALLRAVAYDLALRPAVFRRLATVPALGIGASVYDPAFRRGAIDGAALCLAAALVPGVASEARARESRALALARRLRERTGFAPLVAGAGDAGAYPRLGVVAPSAPARDAALESLAPLGATRMYPAPLGRIAALRPHLIGDADPPGARDFAARLLTLPTHAGLRGARLERAIAALVRISPGGDTPEPGGSSA